MALMLELALVPCMVRATCIPALAPALAPHVLTTCSDLFAAHRSSKTTPRTARSMCESPVVLAGPVCASHDLFAVFRWSMHVYS